MKLDLSVSLPENISSSDDLESRVEIDLAFINGIINRIAPEKRPDIILRTESTMYTYESSEQLADIYRTNRKIVIHWEGNERYFDTQDPLKKQY